jgi:hypothetical protein
MFILPAPDAPAISSLAGFSRPTREKTGSINFAK